MGYRLPVQGAYKLGSLGRIPITVRAWGIHSELRAGNLGNGDT